MSAKKTAKKVPAKKAASTKPKCPFSKGDVVIFKGYSDTDDMTEEDAIFTEGDRLLVESVVKQDGAFALGVVSEDDENLTGSIWAEEAELAEEGEGEEESPYVTAVVDDRDDDVETKLAKAKNPKGKVAKAKTPKAKVAKEKPAPEPIPDFVFTADLEKLVGKSHSEAKALELIAAKESTGRRTEYQLCGLIAFVYHTRAFSALDDKAGSKYTPDAKGFRAYCEEQLETGYRKAMNFVEMWPALAKFEVTEDQFAAVGWVKMLAVTKVANTAKQFEEWSAKAEKTSREKLQEDVTKHLVKQGKAPTPRGNVSEVTRFNAVVANADAATINTAIEAAKAAIWEDGTDEPSVGACLLHICNEWLQMEPAE